MTLPRKLMRDEIMVLKLDGRRSEPVPAAVGNGQIMFESPHLEVDDGDSIFHLLPEGAEEEYVILDSGFQRAILSFPDHYQSKVRKKTVSDERL
ncbi:MAG: hypothetical protein WD273_12240 [Trueperaceae bacterium]